MMVVSLPVELCSDLLLGGMGLFFLYEATPCILEREGLKQSPKKRINQVLAQKLEM